MSGSEIIDNADFTSGSGNDDEGSSTSATATAGDVIVGLILVIIAGCLNGSWNASFSPKVAMAVGAKTTTVQTIAVGRRRTVLLSSSSSSFSWISKRFSSRHLSTNNINANDPTRPSPERRRAKRKTRIDLDYHFAWVLFQTYAALINIPICLYWAGGPQRTGYIISNTSTTDIILIVIFSLLWGIGSVGFGLACRIAGVGLGTNLTMGTIMILGTFLPLLLENVAWTASGIIIIAGLVICSIGLYFSMQSLQTRDLDEKQQKKEQRQLQEQQEQQRRLGHTNIHEEQAADCDEDTGEHRIDHEQEKNEEEFEEGEIIAVEATATSDKGQQRQQEADGAEGDDVDNNDRHDVSSKYTSFQKTVVCVVAGIFATQLQFAFVFGQDMIDIAKSNDGPGGSTPDSGTAAVIWLFAISIGAPVSIVYGFMSSPSHIPLSTIWKCPWWRHILVILTTALPWDAHIHLYGYATTFLPDNLGAAIAWPVLMMITVATGMIWSIGLGEWTQASTKARRQLGLGLSIVVLGILCIMCSAAVS